MKFRNGKGTLENVTININMRCIEIRFGKGDNNINLWININMRCIEIAAVVPLAINQSKININMRCIEIFLTLL